MLINLSFSVVLYFDQTLRKNEIYQDCSRTSSGITICPREYIYVVAV